MLPLLSSSGHLLSNYCAPSTEPSPAPTFSWQVTILTPILLDEISPGGLNNLQRTQNQLVAEPGNRCRRKVGNLHSHCGSTLPPTQQASFPQLVGLCSWQVDGPVFEAGVWLIQKPVVSFPSHQAALLSNECTNKTSARHLWTAHGTPRLKTRTGGCLVPGPTGPS